MLLCQFLVFMLMMCLSRCLRLQSQSCKSVMGASIRVTPSHVMYDGFVVLFPVMHERLSTVLETWMRGRVLSELGGRNRRLILKVRVFKSSVKEHLRGQETHLTGLSSGGWSFCGPQSAFRGLRGTRHGLASINARSSQYCIWPSNADRADRGGARKHQILQQTPNK